MDDLSATPVRTSEAVKEAIKTLDRLLAAAPLSAAEREDRQKTISQLLSVLNAHGVDGESLVRYGMPKRAALPLVLRLTETISTAVEDPDHWRRVLGLPAPIDPATSFDQVFTAHVLNGFEAWLSQAPLTDILNFVPPSESQMQQYRLEHRNYFEDEEPYIWLHSRAVLDDLSSWRTSVLHREYRWQNELDPPAFPVSVLEGVGPDRELLNEEIAFRASAPGSEDGEDDSVFWQLQDTAIGFLSKGQHQEAAALFEFHCKKRPDDPRGINNLGFCKFKRDPGEALHLLQRAEKAGYDALLINIYNQCCCMVVLNRLGDALDRAESFWQREREDAGMNEGFVWVEDEGVWTLGSVNRIDHLLACLMVRVAQRLGKPDREVKWAARAVETSPDPSESK